MDPDLASLVRAGGEASPRGYTLCVIIDGDRLLLKMANDGISKGKLNFIGGRIEKGEGVVDCVKRESLEEAGIILNDVFYHGKIDSYHGHGVAPARVHILSSRSFIGSPRSSDEGEVAWFGMDELPLDRMWKDVQLWLARVYARETFDITVQYSNRTGDAIEDVKVAPLAGRIASTA